MCTSLFVPLTLTTTYVVANSIFTHTHFQNFYYFLKVYRYKGIQYRFKVSSCKLIDTQLYMYIRVSTYIIGILASATYNDLDLLLILVQYIHCSAGIQVTLWRKGRGEGNIDAPRNGTLCIAFNCQGISKQNTFTGIDT